MKTLFSFRGKHLHTSLLVDTFLESHQIRLLLLQAMRSRVLESARDLGLLTFNLGVRISRLTGGTRKSLVRFVPINPTPKHDLHVELREHNSHIVIEITDLGTPMFEGPLFKFTKGTPVTFRRREPKRRRIRDRSKLYQPPPDKRKPPLRGFTKALERITHYIENAAKYESRAQSSPERRHLQQGEITRSILSRIDKQDRHLLDLVLDRLIETGRVKIRTYGSKEIYFPNPEYKPIAPPDSAR